ncbi:hypothetical protein HAX54_021856 [Datura stramonium]|uniref:Uncharacterized protein n=1 Tax=Datura stramonium TaxID=4076 RepID=A0ABS8UVU8_DATST|nr:hypothetical protein [Datura stramonium]
MMRKREGFHGCSWFRTEKDIERSNIWWFRSPEKKEDEGSSFFRWLERRRRRRKGWFWLEMTEREKREASGEVFFGQQWPESMVNGEGEGEKMGGWIVAGSGHGLLGGLWIGLIGRS